MTGTPHDRRDFSDRGFALICACGAIAFLILSIVSHDGIPAVAAVAYAVLAGAFYGRTVR